MTLHDFLRGAGSEKGNENNQSQHFYRRRVDPRDGKEGTVTGKEGKNKGAGRASLKGEEGHGNLVNESCATGFCKGYERKV